MRGAGGGEREAGDTTPSAGLCERWAPPEEAHNAGGRWPVISAECHTTGAHPVWTAATLSLSPSHTNCEHL